MRMPVSNARTPRVRFGLRLDLEKAPVFEGVEAREPIRCGPRFVPHLDPDLVPVEEHAAGPGRNDERLRQPAGRRPRAAPLVEARRHPAQVVGEAGARRVEVEVAQLGVAPVPEAVDERAAARARACRRGGRAPRARGRRRNVSSPSRTKKRSQWVRWTCGEAPSRQRAEPRPRHDELVAVARGSRRAAPRSRRRPRPRRALGGSGGLRRAPLPLSLFVPRRRLASGGAGAAGGGARLRGARAHRPRRRLRLARARARGEARRRPPDHRRRGDACTAART